jgi:hypothetical protein
LEPGHRIPLLRSEGSQGKKSSIQLELVMTSSWFARKEEEEGAVYRDRVHLLSSLAWTTMA